MKSASKLRSQAKVFILTLILISALPNKYYSQDLNNIIKMFCMEDFKNELSSNNDTINLDLGEYVCDCFVNRVNNNESLDSARDKCKKEALEEFNHKTI